MCRTTRFAIIAIVLLFAAGCAVRTQTVNVTGLFEGNAKNMIRMFEHITVGITRQNVIASGFEPTAPNVEVYSGAAAIDILRKFKGDRVDFSSSEDRIGRYEVWIMSHIKMHGKRSWLNIFQKKKQEKGTKLHFIFIFKDARLEEKGIFFSHPSTREKESGFGILIPSLFKLGTKAF